MIRQSLRVLFERNILRTSDRSQPASGAGSALGRWRFYQPRRGAPEAWVAASLDSARSLECDVCPLISDMPSESE